MRKPVVVALVVLVVACGNPGGAPPIAPKPGGVVTTPTTPDPAPTPPGLRLPRTFLPTEYAARLAITPTEATFSGHVDIDGTLEWPSRVIWLHAEHLAISAATATVAGAPVALEVLPSGDDLVALRAPTEIPVGAIRLAITYTGRVENEDTQGVFHQQDGDAWYTYTQFEATSARRAFPCFDEPDVKVPWQLVLDVPAGDVAVSNTPVASDEPSADGKTRTVTFEKTRPLPSYLIAFAVGPFELVDAGKTRHDVPLRVVVPRGHAGEAAWTVEATRPLLDRLEDYFGIPYPYEKLDLVAVPLFPGAMENAGMITYARDILLEKPGESTIRHRRGHASVSAHEMAHQWFGDLVTTAWWDDIWLNEAFATWMAAKVLADWKPEWGGEVDIVDDRSGAMGADSLKSARRIHQPIATPDDIRNAFDGITYEKGAAVIRMFESWVGVDTFQRGIRTYLADHAWKNATSAEFLASIGAAADADVATPFSTFLDQVGAPLISAELSCTKGATPTLKLAQSRYVPQGSDADPNQTWQVPVCASYATGKTTARDCMLLTEASGELPLSKATACPAWVLPNAGSGGYYRVAPQGDLYKRLLANLGKLTLAERVGLIGDVEALVGAGKVPAGDALALVGVLAKDRDRHIVAASAGIAVSPDQVISDKLRPNYQRFVRKMFGAKARALGWTAKPNEDDDTKILRSTLVALVADKGEDKALIAEAQKLAVAWLDDHTAIPADMTGQVLAVGTAHGDRALYDRFLAAAKATSDGRERERLLGALGGFRDPALIKASFDLVLGSEFSILETGRLMTAGVDNPQTRRLVYDLVTANYDALAAKIPGGYAAYLSGVGAALCDPAMRKEVEDFFTPRTAKLPGGPRILAQSLEGMDLCIANREAQRPGVEAFLKKY